MAFESNGMPCRKSGVILTCFVDGKKRFRSAPLGIDPSDQADHDGGSFARSEFRAVMRPTFRRPS